VEITEVKWSAGYGHPTYTTVCPKGTGGLHKIGLEIGGKSFNLCNEPGTACGAYVSDIYATLADDKYDDNSGFFTICLTEEFTFDCCGD
jgi:hypothetical protein